MNGFCAMIIKVVFDFCIVPRLGREHKWALLDQRLSVEMPQQ